MSGLFPLCFVFSVSVFSVLRLFQFSSVRRVCSCVMYRCCYGPSHYDISVYLIICCVGAGRSAANVFLPISTLSLALAISLSSYQHFLCLFSLAHRIRICAVPPKSLASRIQFLYPRIPPLIHMSLSPLRPLSISDPSKSRKSIHPSFIAAPFTHTSIIIQPHPRSLLSVCILCCVGFVFSLTAFISFDEHLCIADVEAVKLTVEICTLACVICLFST